MIWLPNNSGIKLSENLYVANNQNSFNQCLYDYFGCDDEDNDTRYSKKEIREMLQNYPIPNEHHSKGTPVYPCAFVIIDKTYECGRIYVDIIDPFTFDEISHMYMNL